MLNLPELPEHSLPKLCNSILSLSPDLSYSTAATLIRSLLLEKVHHLMHANLFEVFDTESLFFFFLQVLSRSEPASRCLMTAATSLCSHYPRPMCHAVICPVLEDKNIGEATSCAAKAFRLSCVIILYKQVTCFICL